MSRQRGIFTFWLSLSPLTPRGPLNFFLLAKCHPRCGVEAVEGREETWRKTEKECGVRRDPKRPGLGIMAFGHHYTLPRLGHRCSPTRTYASASQTTPLREILIHFPKTQASGPRPQHSHLRTAPPRGRGCGPLSRRPRSQPRCPRMRRSCTARRAPSDRRAGQGALESGRVQPHFHYPSSLAVPVGASVRKRSHGRRRLRLGRQSRRRGGCARQPSWRASAELRGRRTAGKCTEVCGGLRWLTGVKNVLTT